MVPFVIVGIWFAALSVNYQMHDLPPIMVRPIDIIYGIFLAFVDMGTSAGLASLVVLSLVRKALQKKVVNVLVSKVAVRPQITALEGPDRVSELASESSST